MARFWYIPTIIYVVCIILGIAAAFLFRWIQNRRRKPARRATIITATETSGPGDSPGQGPRSRGGAEEIEMQPLKPADQPGTTGGAMGTTPAASPAATPGPSGSSSKKSKTKESIKQA